MARQKVGKEETLEITLKKFHKSQKTTNDYMELFVVFRHVISPGDGISWYTVEEIINKVLTKEEVK